MDEIAKAIIAKQKAKRKRENIIIICVIIIAIVAWAGNMIIKAYKEDVQEQEVANDHRSLKYDGCVETLNLDHPELYCNDGKDKTNEMQKEVYITNELIVSVAYYNVKEGKNITEEQLLEEFVGYIDGEECPELDAFKKSMIGEYSARMLDGKNCTKSEFIQYVSKMLDDGITIEDATLEELEKAIQSAIEEYDIRKH